MPGWAGAQVIREIQAGRYGDCTAVLAVDDNEAKRGAALGRVPVLMDTHKVGEYVQQYRVDEIIIAIATPNGDLSELIHRCIDTGCHVRMVSTLRDVNTGAPALGRVREVNIGDLLGRAEKHLDMTEVEAYFAGKRVLVTGGGGSIGSELCRQIMSFTPAKLVLYDISENYIYDLFFELQEKYGALTRNTVELRVGSIRDKATLDRVFSEFQPEIVIHAAAHKHVPLMEDSPEQAIINNVFGTLNVAQCSLEHGVKRFVMISTDKAVNPTNIMGASKRMAEIIIEALQARGKTQFTAVRFGNVLGSNGSVVPLFERQIRAGRPGYADPSGHHPVLHDHPGGGQPGASGRVHRQGWGTVCAGYGQTGKIRELAERMIQLYADPNGPPWKSYTQACALVKSSTRSCFGMRKIPLPPVRKRFS